MLNAGVFIIIVYAVTKIKMEPNKIHTLKCVLEPFQKKWEGNKNWEFRKNDRDYKVGDILIEQEYNPTDNSFTGREIKEKVVYILYEGFGIPEGHCIMSTKILEKYENQEEAFALKWIDFENSVKSKKSEIEEALLSGEYKKAKDVISFLKFKLNKMFHVILKIEHQEEEDCGCPDKEENK